jgi:hypothetical protein
LPPEETSYVRRGFRGATDDMRARLEQIGSVFLQGYHAALEAGGPERVEPALVEVEHEVRGFAFEGAAMGFALLDWFTPWRPTRLERFLHGAGDAHAYMVNVAVGWVWARVPFGVERGRRRLDSLLGWLAFDGWGFHEGFFHWPKYIDAQPRRPSGVKGYATRVFDQGLGRSFWFVNGGNPDLLIRTIASFPAERQSDLWSGLGLAATYAGFASPETLEALKEGAGVHRVCLAQGAAFASKARQRAGNLTDYTEVAARALCGIPAVEAARLCDTTLENLAPAGDAPAYEVWRRRIQGYFTQLQDPLSRAAARDFPGRAPTAVQLQSL